MSPPRIEVIEGQRRHALELRLLAAVLLLHMLDVRFVELSAKLPALLAASLCVLLPLETMSWALALLGLLIVVARAPLLCANHHYLLIYLLFGVILTAPRPETRGEMLRLLMTALFGVATLQKLLSPEFRSGDYLTLTLARGELLSPLWQLGLTPPPSMRATARALSRAPLYLEDISIVSASWLERVRPWGIALTWLTIAIEAVIAWLAARRAIGALVLISQLFLAGLLVVRDEYVFASILSWVTYALAEESTRRRRIGAALMVAACVLQLLKMWRRL